MSRNDTSPILEIRHTKSYDGSYIPEDQYRELVIMYDETRFSRDVWKAMAIFGWFVIGVQVIGWLL